MKCEVPSDKLASEVLVKGAQDCISMLFNQILIMPLIEFIEMYGTNSNTRFRIPLISIQDLPSRYTNALD